jgi:hypothetical protein
MRPKLKQFRLVGRVCFARLADHRSAAANFLGTPHGWNGKDDQLFLQTKTKINRFVTAGASQIETTKL